jgi:hypothetical protein
MQEYDIYISYAKEDNYPLQGAEQGWISTFQNYLKQILKQVLKRQPFFLSLSNQTELSGEEFKKIKVIVCVISPEFISNKSCLQNLETILELKNKKIFKVIKSKVDPTLVPSELKELKAYDLSRNNRQTEELFLQEPGEDNYSENQWTKLYDLAVDISKELITPKVAKAGQKSRYIYLSETYPQYDKEKVLIKRELEKHGWIVLPNEKYPENVDDLENFVLENLEKCSTSIHLIGSVFANQSSYAESYTIEVENRLAAEYSSKNSQLDADYEAILKFKRFIWIAPELKKSGERHKSFIENFLRNGESIEGAEILQTPLEDFKCIIKTNLESPIILPGTNKINKNSIYLIYDKADQKEAEELSTFFEQTGLEVLRPVFKGGLTEIRKQHFTNLNNCNATIILFGKVNEKWVQMKALDLLKCPAFGRTRLMEARVIYTVGNRKIEREFYKKIDIEILEKRSDDLEKDFSPFLDKIKIIVNG